ncbi:hypothetical protein C0Q70_02070 [Pomacea canaliculata]|uniref:Uncharacterized protein n=1 Tax=Pomacea canaliculata TaxID=400727 RepID=A0A2T7Q196_POMCA|nr:hypothetical protein C0Q70_02070 [Pomacea canaliculata]
METSTDKTKVRDNDSDKAQISMTGAQAPRGQQLQVLGSHPLQGRQLHTRYPHQDQTTTVAMAGLERIWHSYKIRVSTKYKLYKCLVVSILLYGFDTWALLAETEKRIQAFENKCPRVVKAAVVRGRTD